MNFEEPTVDDLIKTFSNEPGTFELYIQLHKARVPDEDRIPHL